MWELFIRRFRTIELPHIREFKLPAHMMLAYAYRLCLYLGELSKQNTASGKPHGTILIVPFKPGQAGHCKYRRLSDQPNTHQT